jgi:hypothetical protein
MHRRAPTKLGPSLAQLAGRLGISRRAIEEKVVQITA